MRVLLFCTVSTVLLVSSGCSRDKPAAPAAAPAAAPTAAATPAAAPAAAPKQQVFGVEELDQMVAPLALYPDPLLAQVLMAATYPGDVAEAAAWAKANPDANGDAAVRQVANQPWDPSVQSLVAFPQALATLGQDPPWVQRLGDAFLAQPDDVMDAIQRLRRKAQSAGTLATNEYQKVSTQPAAPAAAAPAPEPAMGGVESYPEPVASETIIIESADPETVYVPSYDPNTAYGQWDYPSYPPSYYPPPQSYYPMGGALATGLAWGVGFAVADSLWGDADWDNGDIDIDVDSYNNINSNRQIDRSQSNWNHNAANRDGVPYRDQGNRDRNNRRLDGAENRGEFRGEDANRARSREQARQSMEKRGVDTPARSNQEARDRAQSASRDQARQRADTANRERAQADRARTDRAQADRAQADRSRAQAQSRDRAQASQRQQQASRDNARRQQETRHRQSQSNNQARSSARTQQQSRQSPRNDAFQGASRPQQSRQSSQRGQQSHASAQRGGGSRGGGGQQAQRSAPQRQSQPQQRQSRR